MSKHKLHTVRAAGSEQMEAHMNKLQRSKHSKHSSSLSACHAIQNDITCILRNIWKHYIKVTEPALGAVADRWMVVGTCCSTSDLLTLWQILATCRLARLASSGLHWRSRTACSARILHTYMLFILHNFISSHGLNPSTQLVNSMACTSLQQPSQRSPQSAPLPSYSSVPGPGS